MIGHSDHRVFAVPRALATIRRLAGLGAVALALAAGALGAAGKARAQATEEETTAEIRQARSALPEDAAKVLFGSAREPAPLAARSIGGYARGCLAGGTALPINGPAWQVMRLSRNRNWGHPQLIDYLERFAAAAQKDGWPGLLVGDLAQPRGGPMLTGHASHQVGLDADIWLLAMPKRELSRQERETISAVSMLKAGTREVDPAVWSEAHAKLIRRAALDPAVARIFVHPGIKKALCEWKAPGEQSWMAKVRPWYGHHYHFHVRLACPAGSVGCKDQDPPPSGDGCGKDLAWWLGPEPWKPSPPSPPKPPLKLSDLPEPCAQVLSAK